jgi:hypothetical protein
VSLNRTARGIVLVPSVLLGGAFLSAGVWLNGEGAANRGLAFALGGMLLGAGVLTQLLPDSSPELPGQDPGGDPGP